MGKFKKQDTWYGMLESSKGNTVLIWDSVFPEAGKGKVFLYNTIKEAMIEYVEEIVIPKLRDLTGDELNDAHKEYEQGLRELKSQYIEEPEEEPSVAGAGNSEVTSVIQKLDEEDVVVDDEFKDL
jgi:hypothetical protein